MKPAYADWISELHARYAKQCGHCRGEKPCDNVHERGRCQGATDEMVVAFPELRQVRGFVDGSAPHWWCVEADGTIVDPTVGQFAWMDCELEYEEYSEKKHGPLPTGKCADCGDYVYDGGFHGFCNENCERSFRAYLNAEARRR